MRSCRSWNRSSLKHWTKSVFTDLLVPSSSAETCGNLLADPVELAGETIAGSESMCRSTTPGVRTPWFGDVGDVPGDLGAVGDLAAEPSSAFSRGGWVISMVILGGSMMILGGFSGMFCSSSSWNWRFGKVGANGCDSLGRAGDACRMSTCKAKHCRWNRRACIRTWQTNGNERL